MINEKRQLTDHSITASTSCSLADIQTPSIFIFEQGWALPKHSTFRYSKRQIDVLLRIFLDVEKSGKKMSPDQAVQLIRQSKKLPVSEYVTSKQIRSLFSRYRSLER